MFDRLCVGLVPPHILCLFLLCLWHSSASPINIPQSEVNALRDLYVSTNGEFWLQFGVPWNFTGEHNPCVEGWEGITCQCSHPAETLFPFTLFPYYTAFDTYYYDDAIETTPNNGNCSITRLYLGFTNLQGSLPPTIGNLSFLTHFHLEYNHLSSTLPIQMRQLSLLRLLSTFENDLSSTIPSFLGSLTSLEVLVLGGDSMSGTIPNELTSLPRLQIFELEESILSGSLPSGIGNMQNIVVLDIALSFVTGSIPSFSPQIMTRVESLLFSYNLLSGSIPSSIAGLSTLVLLDISDNMLSGTIPGKMTSPTSHF